MRKDFVDQMLAKTAQEICEQVDPKYLLLVLNYLQTVKTAAESSETLDEFSTKLAFSLAGVSEALRGLQRGRKAVIKMSEIEKHYQKLQHTAKTYGKDAARRYYLRLSPEMQKALKRFHAQQGIVVKQVGPAKKLTREGWQPIFSGNA